MANVKNLLHQPLVVDFGKGKGSIHFKARETKPVDEKLLDHPSFLRNKRDLQILVEPKIVTKEVTDKKKKSKQS
jgi:hypothetical protein